MSFERPEWVEVEAHGRVTVLHLSGTASLGKVLLLDDSRRHRVGLQDLSLIAEENAPHILLNFYGLKQIRGPELTPFMRLAMHVRMRKGRIAACHLPDGVQELLEVARLDRIVTVYENQEQAIREMLLPPRVCL
jgi:hypothetical protein